MDSSKMIELVDRLAAAKSKQSVSEALKVLHPDMALETPAIGSLVRGIAENEKALNRFFKSFPDYEIRLDKRVIDGHTMVCWGTAHMTMTGDRFGSTPSGRRIEMSVIIEFEFKDDLISKERFVYDLSDLCAQSGISTDEARRKLYGRAWLGANAA